MRTFSVVAGVALLSSGAIFCSPNAGTGAGEEEARPDNTVKSGPSLEQPIAPAAPDPIDCDTSSSICDDFDLGTLSDRWVVFGAASVDQVAATTGSRSVRFQATDAYATISRTFNLRARWAACSFDLRVDQAAAAPTDYGSRFFLRFDKGDGSNYDVYLDSSRNVIGHSIELMDGGIAVGETPVPPIAPLRWVRVSFVTDVASIAVSFDDGAPVTMALPPVRPASVQFGFVSRAGTPSAWSVRYDTVRCQAK